METTFYPMSHRPKQVYGEPFSETVIVYDEDLEYSDLGFFNFDTDTWSILGDLSMKLVCWTEIPSAKNFMKDKEWKTELHNGYC